MGGTKIEAQVFASDWSLAKRRRIDTPKGYDALVSAMAAQIAWVDEVAGPVPVGVSAAGLVNPATGLALTANLPATGKPFPADIVAAARPITFVNDCRAMTLSEAVFGAAIGQSPVVGLILGTGVGGGVAIGGRLVEGLAMVGGEFGHTAAPAHLVKQYDLPVQRCGCGRMGCVETYGSGPGLTRIAQSVLGKAMTPPEIVAARVDDPDVARVWAIWCEIVAELLMILTLTVDPAVVVLGGGLSRAPGVVKDLSAALARVQLSGFAVPQIVLAEGGDASGARGAAYAALQEVSP